MTASHADKSHVCQEIAGQSSPQDGLCGAAPCLGLRHRESMRKHRPARVFGHLAAAAETRAAEAWVGPAEFSDAHEGIGTASDQKGISSSLMATICHSQ